MLLSRPRLLYRAVSAASATAASNRLPGLRRPVACAAQRGRRSRQATDDSDAEAQVAAAEPQQEEQPEAAPVVASARRGSAASLARSRTTRALPLKPVVTPAEAYAKLGILGFDNDTGAAFVDVSCMGGREPAWFATGVVEGKEARFLDMLGASLSNFGYSLATQSYRPPAEGDAEAAEAAAALLASADVVAWVPSKTMMVYSEHTDRLSEREVRYHRGTGSATLLLHCTLTPLLVEAISKTYFFLTWRDTQQVTAVMLSQHGLLPPKEPLDQVYVLPVPASAKSLAALAAWVHTPEAEDEAAMRTAFYGTAGGSTFGESERYDKDKANMDVDEAGNRVYKRGYAGSYKDPNRWSEGTTKPRQRGAQQQAQQLQPWELEEQQQQGQQQQQQQHRAYAAAGPGGRGSGSERGARDSRGSGWAEREPRAQPRQQQGWHAQQGGEPQQRQQQGGWPRSERGRGAPGPGDGGHGVRMDQMGWMQELGSERYSDAEGPDGEASWGGGSSGPRQAGRSDATRLRQMDWMSELGSERYSDDEEPPAARSRSSGAQRGWQQQQGPQQQQQARAGGARSRAPRGGRDGGRTFNQQLGWMAQMGSDRYAADDDAQQQPGSPPGGSSGASSFLSDVAGALDSLDFSSLGASARNNTAAAGSAGGARGLAGPGQASWQGEEDMDWGRDAPLPGDEGRAAARSVYQAWQGDGAPPGNRSADGLGSSFEFDFGEPSAAATSDPLLAALDKLPVAGRAAPGAAALPGARAPAAARGSRAGSGAAGKPAAPQAGRKAAAAAARSTAGRSARGGRAAKAQAAADEDITGAEDWFAGGVEAGAEGLQDEARRLAGSNDLPGLDDALADRGGW